MTKLVNVKKPSKDMYIDAIKLAIGKTIVERVSMPFVGNGNFISGAIKGGAGFILPMLSGHKYVKYLSTILIMDSTEDVVNGGFQFIGGMLNGSGGNSTDNWS